MYLTASPTVWIFSASSSLISILKASSRAMTSSTVSSESAPRSLTNDASCVTSSGSTPSCSTMIPLTLSSMLCAISPPPAGRASRPCRCGALSSTPIIVRARLHVKTAADVQDLPGDVFRSRAEQERDPGGHVLRGPEPLERDKISHLIAGFLPHPPGHIGVDESRSHGVDRDPSRGDLARQRLGETDQAGLCGAI